MANGFTVQVAYTWSKTMTETGYLNDFDTELERVIGQFDRTHVRRRQRHRRAAVRARPALGRGWNGVTDALLGGWQVSYMFKAQSGAPLGFGNFLFAEGMGIDDVMADDPSRRTSGSTSTRSTG